MIWKREKAMRTAELRLLGKPGIELAEEAIYLLRRTPLSTLAVYYIGSAPFIIGLITFWAAMIQSAYAEQNLPVAALGMALLFIWMKIWQTRFCRHLMAQLAGETLPPWRLKAFWRTLSLQSLVHATGLIVLPFALLITIPFGWVYATYQNATVLDNGEYPTLTSLFQDAVAQAKLWPKQNHILIWLLSPFLLIVAAGMFLGLLPIVDSFSPVVMTAVAYLFSGLLAFTLLPLSPFGMIIAINIGTGILFCASMLNVLLGVETVFSLSGGAALNSTFIAMVCGLAFLCMDPALKAAYVLRCFYGNSLKSGEDLRVELRRYTSSAGNDPLQHTVTRAVLAAFLIGSAACFLASSGGRVEAAPEMQVTPEQIDQALSNELDEWQYTWRMPRLPRDTEEGFIQAFLRGLEETIYGYIQKFGDWVARLIRDWFSPDLGGWDSAFRTLAAIGPLLRALLYGLLLFLAAALGYLLWRLWQRRQPRELGAMAAVLAPVPDIADESTTAADLPEEGWLTLARELLAKGEYRLAIRALFLATLARLSAAGYIRIVRSKSNGEYLRELRRRAQTAPELPGLFVESTQIYEAIWYGEYDAAEEGCRRRMIANFQQMPRPISTPAAMEASHE